MFGIDTILALAYVLAGLTVVFGILAVESPRLMRATFYFGIFAVLLGEIYILLGVEFIGVIQILVYAGGVAILIVFSLMFLPRTEKAEEVPYAGHIRALIGIALVLIFVGSIGYVSSEIRGKVISMSDLSAVLLGGYSLVVVLVLVLLFVTMLTASYLAVEEG